MADGLTIDREFADLCGQQTPEELNLLEQSLLAHGCLDPIITWANHDDTVLDGHTRYRLCGQLGINGWKTKALKFETREDARNWIIDNQLARRNLSDERKAYLRGKRYQAEKKSEGGRADRDVSGGHNAHPKTSAKLAAQFHVDEKTIRRDADFAEAVDTIGKNAGKQIKNEILSGRSGLTKKEVVAIAQEPADKQAKAIEVAKRDTPRNGEIKTDDERLLERIEQLIEFVNRIAAHQMGHNTQSKAVVKHLEGLVPLVKAMRRSWRNK